jgi:hypothetical protein
LKQVVDPEFEKINFWDNHKILYESGGETLLPTTFCMNRGDTPPFTNVFPKNLFGKGRASPRFIQMCFCGGPLFLNNYIRRGLYKYSCLSIMGPYAVGPVNFP